MYTRIIVDSSRSNIHFINTKRSLWGMKENLTCFSDYLAEWIAGKILAIQWTFTATRLDSTVTSLFLNSSTNNLHSIARQSVRDNFIENVPINNFHKLGTETKTRSASTCWCASVALLNRIISNRGNSCSNIYTWKIPISVAVFLKWFIDNYSWCNHICVMHY